MAYEPLSLEERMQRRWEEAGVARTPEVPGRRNFYCLEMFMYPSGRIHMGHVRNYTIGDVVARFQRMRGRNVLHPPGFDAFGLPAENAAIKGGVHPKAWTDANMAAMRDQLRRLGFLYDWNREVVTCEPEYYRWNQWFFLRMFEKGLCYKAKRPVNWCPSCATVLANEQVENGTCWRCHNPVEIRELDQWFLKLTHYAEELLRNLDDLSEWPPEVVAMQRNWIGRSEGALVDFPVAGQGGTLTVFTTRLDTIYGATYLLLAPEHPAVEAITSAGQRAEVEAFRAKMRSQSTHERATTRDKEGVFTGAWALNPFSGERIPVWVANFVLMDYGTGAIMSVPAHDQRDFEFARAYGLPVRVVVQSGGLSAETLEAACADDGVLVESGPFTGLPNREAAVRMAALAEEKGFGKRTVQYRIKDWGISRQRYWGTPIPIVYCPACGTVPVPEEDLPVLLPKDVAFTGRGQSPLATHGAFLQVPCPRCGKEARRETDTMDTFVDSSWYFLRYTSPRETSAPFDRRAVEAWCPVDFYIGGIEHATMHLIYCRFFTMVLRDLGLLPFGEPVKRLMCQGMVIKDGAKMSKSLGNLVEPDEMVARYGADAVRLNMLFVSPPWDRLDWQDSGAEGAFRFLARVHGLVEEWAEDLGGPAEPGAGSVHPLRRKVHQTVARVERELDGRLKINTAVAALMELANALLAFAATYDRSPAQRFVFREALGALVQMLSPFTPHLADALWERLGGRGFLVDGPWPAWDPALAAEEEVTLPVQVNGRLRGQVTVPAGASAEEILAAARSHEKVRPHLEGRTVVKEIAVPGKVVNFVVR
ncbi:MAG: leucine--tRNA ligase [Acidobacteriota bacterium]